MILIDKQLKERIQKRQFGYAHDDLTQTENTHTVGTDHVYVYSFSMTPTRPELNHGSLSFTNLANPTLDCKVANTGSYLSANDTVEMLFITRNRAHVRTVPQSNGTLTLHKDMEA